MADDAGVLQARALLGTLFEHVTAVSEKLEIAEGRARRVSARGALHDRRQEAEWRRELYQLHRLVDGLHRRYPQTIESAWRADEMAGSGPLVGMGPTRRLHP